MEFSAERSDERSVGRERDRFRALMGGTLQHATRTRYAPEVDEAAIQDLTELTPSPECSHNDHMERTVVGARELKTRLGTYLRRVREGRTLLVTDRGEPVAELRPLPRDTSVSAALLKLSSQRAVTLPLRKSMAAFRPIDSQGRALSDAVLEDRKDRF